MYFNKTKLHIFLKTAIFYPFFFMMPPSAELNATTHTHQKDDAKFCI